MWTQNKLFQPQHPQNDPICTCEESGLIGCPIHDLEITHFPTVVSEIRHEAIERCALAAADWFNVPSRERTKRRLLEMIRKEKHGFPRPARLEDSEASLSVPIVKRSEIS